MHLPAAVLIGTGSGSVKVLCLQAARKRRFGMLLFKDPSIENESICGCNIVLRMHKCRANLVQSAVILPVC